MFSFSFETEIVVCDLNAGLVCDPDSAEPTCRPSLEVGDTSARRARAGAR